MYFIFARNSIRILPSFLNKQIHTNPYIIFIASRSVKIVESANFPRVIAVIIVDGDTLDKTSYNIVVI